MNDRDGNNVDDKRNDVCGNELNDSCFDINTFFLNLIQVDDQTKINLIDNNIIYIDKYKNKIEKNVIENQYLLSFIREMIFKVDTDVYNIIEVLNIIFPLLSDRIKEDYIDITFVNSLINRIFGSPSFPEVEITLNLLSKISMIPSLTNDVLSLFPFESAVEKVCNCFDLAEEYCNFIEVCSKSKLNHKITNKIIDSIQAIFLYIKENYKNACDCCEITKLFYIIETFYDTKIDISKTFDVVNEVLCSADDNMLRRVLLFVYKIIRKSKLNKNTVDDIMGEKSEVIYDLLSIHIVVRYLSYSRSNDDRINNDVRLVSAKIIHALIKKGDLKFIDDFDLLFSSIKRIIITGIYKIKLKGLKIYHSLLLNNQIKRDLFDNEIFSSILNFLDHDETNIIRESVNIILFFTSKFVKSNQLYIIHPFLTEDIKNNLGQLTTSSNSYIKTCSTEIIDLLNTY